ncbi:molybdopterin molybdotransferase MoeA [Streptomyces sp. RB6PN25]|uniref:Molybdopterin molybdenumtransferase n=2 Tax=Streptomyces humicola TaxID=2953240 RepID=A0ABT1PZU9_9ACTN|nr:molybdopterin molybdotransferase MoeA [Streptomyces humicola]MCQ4083207.1 molybdopterin molybdotransferase MoeA [Streptomyces humicola]
MEDPAAAAEPGGATPWPEARRIARDAARPLSPVTRPLAETTGTVLAEPLAALSDLPSFDTSAMDGWAVSGPGPWLLSGELLAGQRPGAAPLPDGHAIRIATGAALPPGATAVLRSEDGRTEERGPAGWLHVADGCPKPEPGQDVRPRGQECRSGDHLLASGTPVTPALIGLAAAAGYDELTVTPRPRVDVLVLGDELLDDGPPRDGRVRDALGPLLTPWLRALGAGPDTTVRRLHDDPDLLHQAVGSSTADLIITTGGTAAGPVDFVHLVVHRLGARLLVDGVAVRPGHPMLLALLPAGRPLVGLPGNPLAAVTGVLTLAAPLLRALGGRPDPVPYAVPLAEPVAGHPVDTRLIPVAFDDASGAARPLRFRGPAMLRGLAAADAMAVIPPGGAEAGAAVDILDVGWGSAS